MVDCKRCGRVFRDSYNLKRHLSKTNQCFQIQNVEKRANIQGTVEPSVNGTLETTESIGATLGPTEPTLETTNVEKNNEKEDNKSNTCSFCLHTFSKRTNIKNHENSCKFKDDQVRLLEIELCIKIDEPTDPKTECRFCNQIFSRSDSLFRHVKVCNERKIYHEKLLKQKENKTVNIINNNNQVTNINNNITNNNITNNNITNNVLVISNFGDESVEHISDKQFISLLDRYVKKLKFFKENDEKYKLELGNLILEFEQLINKDPSNKNSWITNAKADFGIIKLNNKEKMVRFNNFVDKILINASKKLSTRHDIYCEEHFVSDDINFLLTDAYEYKYGLEHQNLSRKSIKELNDNIRINKVRQKNSTN
jgi:uncharacterized C2H2 Zn-finger protein